MSSLAVLKYGNTDLISIIHICYVVPAMLSALCMSLLTVNTIALAKPEKAKMVESMLIQMAQTGQIQGKVSELLA